MVLSLFRRERICRPSERILGYTVEKIMGEGRYGICYQASCGGKRFILKQLKAGMLRKAGAKARYEEEILMRLKHESIPRLIGKIALEDFRGYVLEFKEGKTFEELLYLDRHVFSREEIFGIGGQLIGIIRYLQSEGVVHRDIRVPNTLYDGQRVNLVDFGLARRIDREKYKPDMDFAFLGDFLLHLYYSAFEYKGGGKRPWHEELGLADGERRFLKRLLGIEKRYQTIHQVENDFNTVKGNMHEVGQSCLQTFGP